MNRGHLKKYSLVLEDTPQQHSILPIITSSTPKIPSANLLFQPHPPNIENASSLILLQCFREPYRRDPIFNALGLLWKAPGGFKANWESRWWSHCPMHSGSVKTSSGFGRDSWECSRNYPKTLSHLAKFYTKQFHCARCRTLPTEDGLSTALTANS
jgi:hypothetical protein